MRRTLLLMGLVVTATLAATVTTSQARTKRMHYSPFNAAGQVRARLHVRHVHGNCWTSSLTNPRGDAWRCMTGRWIYDPCFESPIRFRMAVCPGSPWSRKVVVLHGPLDYEQRYDFPHSFPWALTTSGGWHCTWVAGASNVVRGKRANYFCGNEHVLFGLPNRRPSTWRIYGARSADGAGWRKVKIKASWT